MNCVILQPSYLPWRGFFHQIYKADIFVFYDDVQYDRHGWRNRNRIKTAAGSQWLTIPLKSAGSQWKESKICDMQIAWERKWNQAHFETLRHAYSKAPFFRVYEPMLRTWYNREPEQLADFTIETTIDLARTLGITQTRFVRSSTLNCSGTKTDRLLQILEQVSAKNYISGPAAKDYLEVNKLEGKGIGVEWMTYDYPEYPQLHSGFDPQLSVVDLLMMTGAGAGEYIWGSASESPSAAPRELNPSGFALK